MRSAPSPPVDCDVIIIGAGAAGLAAARTLSVSGRKVIVLEGRDRIGGRVFTRHVAALPVPVELGAEFIHGEVDSTLDIVNNAALRLVQLPDEHLWSGRNQLEPIADFWGEVDQIRKKISRIKTDVSFADFLDRTKITPRLRAHVRSFVEGYHAAHLDRISALSLAMTDQEVEGGASNHQFRIVDGYDAVMQALHAATDRQTAELRLNHTVTAVRWRKERVEVDCNGLSGSATTLRARAVIITVPIGVLRGGAIQFDPPLTRVDRAVAKLESGSVMKMALRFREEFWNEEFLKPRLRGRKKETPPLQFIHKADAPFPTWWTHFPLRVPLLTAWAGGEKADLLARASESTRIERALDSLRDTLHIDRATLEQQLDATFSHDWINDPFSLGAYSYVGVGGRNAQRVLAQPIEQTLFFAGEATSSDQTGTVAGAIESGMRAANAVR